METKKEYIAPELTVVSFKTERGYASSSENPLAALQIFTNMLTGLGSGNIEQWDYQQNDATLGDDAINWQ